MKLWVVCPVASLATLRTGILQGPASEGERSAQRCFRTRNAQGGA
jgi:hypothetical protein